MIDHLRDKNSFLGYKGFNVQVDVLKKELHVKTPVSTENSVRSFEMNFCPWDGQSLHPARAQEREFTLTKESLKVFLQWLEVLSSPLFVNAVNGNT